MSALTLSELGRTYLEHRDAIEKGRNALRADAQAILREVARRYDAEDCAVAMEGTSVVVRWPYEEGAEDPLELSVRLVWDGDHGWPELLLNDGVDDVWKAILPPALTSAPVLDEAAQAKLLVDPVGVCFDFLDREVSRLDGLHERDEELWLRYSVRQMMKATIPHLSASGKLQGGGVEQKLHSELPAWPCCLWWWDKKERLHYPSWSIIFAPDDSDETNHQLLLVGNQVETDAENVRPYSDKYYVVSDLKRYLTSLEKSESEALPEGIAERLASEALELCAVHRRR
ncbi:MAG: hypothetical protein ACOC0J_01335 [Myxococcota bacterium]